MSGIKKGGTARNGGRWRGDGRHWATPPELFAEIDSVWHFTLDPCCTPETAKCQRFYTEADDGLTKSWAGERVFMNPPYGREIPAWTRKAKQESQRIENPALVVGLLPASTDLAWWHDDIEGIADYVFLRGRPKFLCNGLRVHCFTASVVVIWYPTTFDNVNRTEYEGA